ncbi:BCAS3 domain-containing protein [Balamuthia mandrillaris]
MSSAATNPGVPIVAEKHRASEQGYLQNLGSYVQGFSSYIPASLKKQMASPAPLEDSRDRVLFTAFDTMHSYPSNRYLTPFPYALRFQDSCPILVNHSGHGRQQCLVQTHVNGFQVWDIEDLDNVVQIVSKREGAIKCAKFLCTSPTKNRLSGRYPILALASAEEGAKFPKNAVKFYSLKEQDYLNMIIRFPSEVFAIHCSNRLLVVSLYDQIYCLDINTLKKKLVVSCYAPRGSNTRAPSSSGGTYSPATVMALGPRWLAYAATKPVPRLKGEDDTQMPGNQIVDMAKYLSDVGRKTMASYMYPDSSPPPSDDGIAGTVIVHDVCTGEPIAHFRAHKQPLSMIAFDPSGTLLVTASVGGYELKVFQIVPSADKPIQKAFSHIYTLVRGRTSAVITDLCFSNDSRWLAASSARGTTHIFAINPEGGPVNIYTHIPSEPLHSFEAPFLLHSAEPRMVTLAVCDRLKQTHTPDEYAAQWSPIAAHFVGTSGSMMGIFVATQHGILTKYKLLPHGPTQPDMDPKSLLLTSEPLFYWDVSRRSSWPQYLKRPRAKDNLPSLGQSPSKNINRWLANVEICTHTPHYRPLWAGPQFTFKTFTKRNALDTVSDRLNNSGESEVRVQFNPIPVNKSGEYSVSSSLELNAAAIPSTSPDTEETVKASLSVAMSTPMDFPSRSRRRADSSSFGGSSKANRDDIGQFQPQAPSSLSDAGDRATETPEAPHFDTSPHFGFYDDDDDDDIEEDEDM